MVLIFSLQIVKAIEYFKTLGSELPAISLSFLGPCAWPDWLGFVHSLHPIMHESRCGFCSAKGFEVHSSSVKSGKKAV